MLVRLLPDQIARFWDIIKYAVEESLPPVVSKDIDNMQNVLTGCLDGSLEVWASYSKKDNVTKLEGIILTQFIFDRATKTKNLLIYCLYGYNQFSKDSWTSGIESLKKYAKAKGCSQIVAYSDVPLIINLAKQLGADTKYTFISFDL